MKKTQIPTEQTLPLYLIIQCLYRLNTAFRRPEPYLRACQLFLAELLACGRKTVTQLWEALGFVHLHPTSAYRLFQRTFPIQAAQQQLLQAMVESTDPTDPFLVVADGTQVRRTGRQIPGVHWRYSPHTAPFARGLHRAQSFVVMGWLTPSEDGHRRCLPFQMEPVFSAKAKRAPAGACCSEVERVSAQMHALRAQLDAWGRSSQPIVGVLDGQYDTRKFWASLPDRVGACVRTRSDARLCDLPAPSGRQRVYGTAWSPSERWQTAQGWQRVSFRLRGRTVRLQVQVHWCRRRAWGEQVFGCVLVRGHHGRGRQKQRRAQAFLVSAVPDGAGGWQLPVPLPVLLEWLWQRWEVEVCLREMKSGFGLGQKQCWGLTSGVRSVQWSAWVYGVCLWSGYQAWGVCRGPRYRTGWYTGRRRWTYRALERCLRRSLIGLGVHTGRLSDDFQRLGGQKGQPVRSWLLSYLSCSRL
ncbi:MAG: hypothetical protein KIT45_14690 [Fimbriimonadia bacterium]|nr:hypothetical protein [Fimbriimonadia bacterium]